MPARPTLGSHTSRRRTPNRAFATPSRCVGTSANVEHAGIHTALYWVPYTGCPTEMSRNLRLLGEAGGQPGKWLTLAWLLTQLGVHRVQVADTSQDLPSYRSPAWFSGMGGDGRGGEERKESGYSSAFPLAQSWAPCHVHTPLRAGHMFCFRSHCGT